MTAYPAQSLGSLRYSLYAGIPSLKRLHIFRSRRIKLPSGWAVLAIVGQSHVVQIQHPFSKLTELLVCTPKAFRGLDGRPLLSHDFTSENLRTCSVTLRADWAQAVYTVKLSIRSQLAHAKFCQAYDQALRACRRGLVLFWPGISSGEKPFSSVAWALQPRRFTFSSWHFYPEISGLAFTESSVSWLA